MNRRSIIVILFCLVIIALYSQNEITEVDEEADYKITFVSLGADNCMPCKMMRPIMKEIADEYQGIVKVVFYDVWKEPHHGQYFRVRVIPTQIFFDSEGNEFYRNEGFFPKDQIKLLLDSKLESSK